MDKLDKLLDDITDRDSFLEFVRALKNDREDEVEKEKSKPSKPYGPGANGWENGTIDAYLDASIAWAVGGDKYSLPQQPSWKSFARFLYAGKYYE